MRAPVINAVQPATPFASPEAQRPLLVALGAATFMVGLDGRVVAPLLPTIAQDLGVSLANTNWLISGYMLPYGLCQLIYGPLADRFGKLRVATNAMIAFSIGTAVCGAFPSFAAIVVLRALTGAAAAALIPLTIAYIGDTVPYAQRQAALAMLMASSGAAQAFSTSAGGTIAALVSWRTVFPILGGLAGITTLGLFAFRDRELRVARDAMHPPTDYRSVLRAPSMLALLVLIAVEGALYMGGFSSLSGLLASRFQLDALGIGLVLGVLGIAQVVSARMLPRLLRRLTERQLVLIGGGAMGASYLLCSVGPHWAWVTLACTLMGTGFSLCHSTLQTRATELYPAARGTAIALFAFSLFAGGGMGTVAIGYASAAFGFRVTFAAVGAMLLIFALTAVRALKLR